MRSTTFAGAALLLSCARPALARTIEVPGGVLEVRFVPGRLDLGEDAIAEAIRTSARAVAGYFGRFPIARMPVVVEPTAGAGVHGHADDEQVSLQVGEHATRQTLRDDWVITHELVHLALPDLPRRHHWMEEGLATYVEPIARAQVGGLSAERVWGDLVDGLPQGLPEAGDRGLDFTPTWGRTYWGGALYWLLADVEIRARSNHKRGLQQALRGIVAAGGNMQQHWSVDRVIAAGDGATGVPVLRELYDQMKASPHPVDLPALWRRLGVVKEGDTVRFDDAAPLAAVRRAITQPQ
jgi:hypothetical protein